MERQDRALLMVVAMVAIVGIVGIFSMTNYRETIYMPSGHAIGDAQEGEAVPEAEPVPFGLLAECGDHLCDPAMEDCRSCAEDCGVCQ